MKTSLIILTVVVWLLGLQWVVKNHQPKLIPTNYGKIEQEKARTFYDAQKVLDEMEASTVKSIDNRKDGILQDYSFGGSISFLAKKYGCSRNTMRDKLKEWGAYVSTKFKGDK